MKPRFLSTVVALAVVALAFSAGVRVLGAQAQPSSADTPSAPLLAIADQVAALFPRVSGHVLEVQGSTVTLSIGKRDGMQPGLEMLLIREGRELRHPKTGEILGRVEKPVGRVRVEQVFEAYSTGSVPAGTEPAAGDVARISAGKQRVTVVALVSGVRETIVEAAITEIVDALNRTGRFQVSMGDAVGVWAAQRGITPEQVLEGRGLAEAAERFRLEHVLALHFSTVQRRPFVEARFMSLPRTTALMTSTAFVPPSVRVSRGQRFSAGGDRNPNQPRQRSLLARILGGELEAGSYSSGENSIPLREIGKFGFAVLSMDVSVAPRDQVPRLVLTDGDRIWLYRVVERALEPEWTYDNRFSRPGRIMSVQLADLDGDGVFEVVANRFHPDTQILLTSFILGVRDGKPVEIASDTSQFLYAVDADGSGVKKTLWGQAFSRETFFRSGHAERRVLKGDTLVSDGMVRVPATFRATGATMANIAGKPPGPRSLVFVDEHNRLRIAIDSEETFRSSTPVGGGSHLKMELFKMPTERGGRSEFYYFQPTPLAVDLDGDGLDEVVVPQNQLDGHLAIVFRGPAGYRLQSVNSGFEGTITALGVIPGDNPPTLIAAVVRFSNFLKSAGETQIIMTTGE
ncbi:MAG TPA: VCBS repeat-containing protein [Methylomirabilota bacterium]|nr:VCBS repeat-containing protein [Methylomirabilota bacterium]